MAGALHFTLRIGAKRNWPGSQETLVGLLSPEAAGRASLGHAEAFTGVNLQKLPSCGSCPNSRGLTPECNLLLFALWIDVSSLEGYRKQK